MIPGSANPLLLKSAAAAGGYQIERSLRFNASDSAYLSQGTSRTPAANTSITFSFWLKLSSLSTDQQIIWSNPAAGFLYIAYWGSYQNGALWVGNDASGLDGNAAKSNGVLRDPSAWYHILYSRAHGSNGILYINGVQQTTQAINTANVDFFADSTRSIGRRSDDNSRYASLYLADFHCIDGQALTPSSFTEVSATTGQLVPIAYTGTYGLVSVAAATGALPIFNTTDTYGAVKGTGTRTDTNSASIVLALPMDGTNGGTSFGDQSAVIKGSGSAKTITVNGNTNTSTTQSKFYGSSGYFDGSGDYLTVNYDSDLDFTGQFTFEGWVYPNVSTGDHSVFGNFVANATGNWGLGFDYSTYGIYTVFYYEGNTSIGNTGYVPTAGKWNHYAVTRDAGNVIRVFLNGQLLPTTATYSGTLGVSSQNTIIGFRGGLSSLNGSIQDVRFYKGVAKYTSNFSPVVSYNNSFYLQFADNSSNTATTLGKDTSGNGNNWTPNNLSITAGAGNDSLVDSPTSYGTDTGVGGEVRGNYCTLNPLKTTFSGDGSLPSQSNGNLDVTGGGGTSNTVGTIGVSSGKFYYETTLTATHDLNACIFGLGQSATAYSNNFGLRPSGSFGGTITSGSAFAFAIGDTVGIAYEPGVSATFYKNNNASSFVASLSSGIWFPWAQLGGTTVSAVYNFGQRPFVNQSVPSGFKALCDTNLGAPLTAKPNTLFDVVLWTGTGAARSITGLAFNPDWVWIKSRSSGTYNHRVFDTVRGATKELYTSLTNAESTASTSLTSFNSNGFSLDSDPGVNEASTTYVGWAWDAGTSTVSNTAGSITSQVRANASAGFSVVSFTTQSSSTATVGHGLNVAPTFIIQKIRTLSADWYCYHTSIGAGNIIQLNTTAASSANSTIWNNTAPTSTVWTLGNGWTGSYSTIAYCFAPVVGYSNGFSYTGNGSTDGVFQYLGFRPRLILLKCSSTTGNWTLLDTAREGYNVDNDPLYPNLSNAEGTTDLLDITSNGFKLRTTDASVNSSGATYIGFAWAEAPFAYSRAR